MIKDVCCIGSAILDITTHPVDFNALPGSHLQASETLIGPGGCAGNVGIGLVSLNKEVDLLARVGAGHAGQQLRDFLRQRGVDTTHLVNDPEVPTGKTVVLVNQQGERRFIYTPGANARLEPGDLVNARPDRYRLIHISDAFLLPEVEGPPLANLLRQAKIGNCLTSLDTIWDPSGRWLKLLLAYLPYLDFLFCSDEEAVHLFPGATAEVVIERLLSYGTRAVILKQGAKGSIVGTKSLCFHVPAHPVTIRDTTGAGDAYVAAFLAGILEGMSLREAAHGATLYASANITQLGATGESTPHQDLADFVALS